MQLYQANREWRERPDDERYLSLDDLLVAVRGRRERSRQEDVALEHFTVQADEAGAIRILPKPGLTYPSGPYAADDFPAGGLGLTSWTFGQLCARARAPAGYLGKLPALIAQYPLAWSLETAERDDGQFLIRREGDGGDVSLRAITSPRYGRIWDEEVVSAIRSRLDPSAWKVPAASYAATDPKRATTLYASDRDIFIFLVDESRPIQVNGEGPLFRGFFAWNSEVGAATFGLTTFLYRRVCDNRIVWGAEDVSELKIRHTAGGPSRFIGEAAPALQKYLDSSTAKTIETVKRSAALEVGKSDQEVLDWLQGRGFSDGLSKRAIEGARTEPGSARSVWNLVQGLTAAAQDIPHTDARVSLERQAGRLLEVAAS